MAECKIKNSRFLKRAVDKNRKDGQDLETQVWKMSSHTRIN